MYLSSKSPNRVFTSSLQYSSSAVLLKLKTNILKKSQQGYIREDETTHTIICIGRVKNCYLLFFN